MRVMRLGGRSRSQSALMARLLAASMLIATATGCGVAVDKSAHRVPNSFIPEELSNPSTPPVTSIGGSVVVYFAKNGRLAPVLRAIPAAGAADLETQALLELENGPTEDERLKGMSSALESVLATTCDGGAIPERRPIVFSRQERGVAVLDLGGLLGNDEAAALALAQIVFTITDLPGIGSVRFVCDAVPIGVIRQDLSLVESQTPVVKDDFCVPDSASARLRAICPDQTPVIEAES